MCPSQQLIFSTNIFFHATTGTGPVFLVSHISAADRKKVANNGNKVMGWCVGLKTPGPWNFARQDTNGIRRDPGRRPLRRDGAEVPEEERQLQASRRAS